MYHTEKAVRYKGPVATNLKQQAIFAFIKDRKKTKWHGMTY